MTDIDETTGLPVLPEGMFWRVEENALLIMENREPGEWSGWAYGSGSTFQGISTHDLETRTRNDGPNRFWWQDNSHTEYRWRRASGPFALFMKKFGTWEPFGSDGKRFVENSPVTPENLLGRAMETLADWDQLQASKAILGDYPPKRFGVTS